MNFGPEQIRYVVTYVLTLIISVAVHEWGHAYVATRLGDDLPGRQGRVTLNPMAHADPVGTILLPIITAVYAVNGGGGGGFGWGKPVMTNPQSYTRRFSMATGSMFVALAGPCMNVVLALVVSITHVVLLKFDVFSIDHPLNMALLGAVGMNFTLFFFNLLPTPPLDGGYVVARFVPAKHQPTFKKIAVYGPFILLAFVMISPLSKVFTIPAGFCTQHTYRLLSFIFGMA
jgi:Zn-dependent protease